ncbi:MAG TPA: ATP synthase subunit I [Burkholderiales bacterium]|nr:ATP synthase subunit I [Burkholderiales bacterium]
MTTPERSAGGSIRRIIGLQAGVGVVITLLLLALYGIHIALSALIGGAIAVIASGVYAWRMSVPPGSDPRRMLRAHFAAEYFRFGVTVSLFAGVFLLYGSVAALPLFLTYVAALLVYWVALILN